MRPSQPSLPRANQLHKAMLGAGLILATSTAAAANETIVLISGQSGGNPGFDCQLADNTTYFGGPINAPVLPTAFTPLDFDAACLNGSNGLSSGQARAAAVQSGWSPSLPGAPGARWTSWRGFGGQCSALYCVEFEVRSPSVSSATIELDWLASPHLGGETGDLNLDGVYLNGTALGPNFRGGNPSTVSSATDTGIGTLLNPGINHLFFYVPDTPSSSRVGFMYSARIDITGPNGPDSFEPNNACSAPATLGSGSEDDLTVSFGDDDWYEIAVPGFGTFEAEISLDNDFGDIDLSLFAANCAPLPPFSWTSNDIEAVEWTNPSSVPVNVRLQVHLSPTEPFGTCNTYDLRIESDNCPGTEDAYSPNHVPTSSFSLGNGDYTGLYVEQGIPDWYSFSVANGATLEIESEFAHLFGDVNLVLRSPSGGAPLDSSNSDQNIETVSWPNTTGAAAEVWLRVSIANASANPCNEYSLSVRGARVPFAANDAGGGFYQLTGLSDGSDWCVGITIPDEGGGLYTAPVVGLTAGDDENAIRDAIELAIDSISIPGYFVDFTPSTATAGLFNVVACQNFGDFDSVSVNVSFGDDCSSVDCTIGGSTTECTVNPMIGRLDTFAGPYCDGVPNSTGVGSRVNAYGSLQASENFFFLNAIDLPANTVGYFIAGSAQGLVMNPAGSQGNLCVNGTLLRLLPNSLATGAMGSLIGEFDLTNVGGQGVAFLPGERWNFQCWHRDLNPTVTSNFSEGVFVDFE